MEKGGLRGFVEIFNKEKKDKKDGILIGEAMCQKNYEPQITPFGASTEKNEVERLTLFLEQREMGLGQTIQVESLFNIHEPLASILKKLNYDVKATYRRTPEDLERICSLSNHIIIIDEANDLNARVLPYLKRVIDAGVPIVFAGLPKVRTFLASEHPDILSHLKVLVLYPIIVEDFIMEYKKSFKAEVIEKIYMAVHGDMRKFEEICTDCLDRAKELKYSFVYLNLALKWVGPFEPSRCPGPHRAAEAPETSGWIQGGQRRGPGYPGRYSLCTGRPGYGLSAN